MKCLALISVCRSKPTHDPFPGENRPTHQMLRRKSAGESFMMLFLLPFPFAHSVSKRNARVFVEKQGKEIFLLYCLQVFASFRTKTRSTLFGNQFPLSYSIFHVSSMCTSATNLHLHEDRYKRKDGRETRGKEESYFSPFCLLIRSCLRKKCAGTLHTYR